MDRGAWQAAFHGVAESDMTEQLSTAQAPSAKIWKQAKCPLMGIWIKKMYTYKMHVYMCVYKHMLYICEILLNHKRMKSCHL